SRSAAASSWSMPGPRTLTRRPGAERESRAVSRRVDPVEAGTLTVRGREYAIAPLDERAARLPYSLRVLLGAVQRSASRGLGDAGQVEAVAGWRADAEPSGEIAFRPARVLLQDFTGVPAIVDLAAMREAMRDLGGDPAKINPQLPAELVVDHS